ncbi:MAG: M4 family metallopeptidase, partial [Bacteroidetes bacterium]|nr:M4 family metallopeptidase [Bacteroidota bacterium]
NNLGEKEVLQQYHIGYPVEGAVYYLHYNNKREIIAANGQLWRSLPETATVGISEATALEQAKKSNHFQGSTAFKPSDKPELVFAPVRNERGEILDHRLCYKIDVYSTAPLRRAWVYIDAESGKEVGIIDRLHETNATGTAHTRYSGEQQISTKAEGGQYLLRDYTRGNGILTRNANSAYNLGYVTDFTDADNLWNTTTNYDNAAYDAHWGAIKTMDYFRETFDRNSFDNDGATVNLYVHFGNMYNNAFWDGENLVFGDGSNSYDGFTPLTSIDVVAHEFTHAVTTHSANLIYAYESGALNESFSDIFGAVVEHYAKPEVANYLVGEEITVGGGALRSMIRPNDYQHPDTYGGTYYYTGSDDNGGVHYNSGVQNHWFYLLSEGGSGTNDLGNAFTVPGIGITKAAAISYRNLTTYLTPNASYEDAAFYAILAAEDLYGACSAEAQATAQAWYAVGVIDMPTFETTAEFSASQTYSCSIQTPITFNNQSQWSNSYSWDFGDGTTSTEANPVHQYSTAGSYTVTLTAYPDGGCGTTSSTITKAAYITVEDGGQPIAATCTPSLYETCCDVGIRRTVISNLDHSTTEWDRGYSDYTCQPAVQLIQGDRVDFQFSTRYTYGEKLQAYVDWNNNGNFEETERFYTSGYSLLTSHAGTLSVPNTAVLNQPLRMRLRSSALDSAPMGNCDAIRYGEVHDYTVLVQANTQAPIADFATVGPAITGSNITFQDNTQFVATSWRWTFEGASVATSQEQNPVVSFAQTGTYRVSLTASNAYGSSTVSKNIFVSEGLILCQDTQSSNTSGVLYDSGGKNGNYSNYERCSFTYRSCGPITINLNLLGIERGYDYLSIYDGQSAAGTRLFYSQYSDNGSYTLTAHSGSFYVYFTTDGSVVGSGFEIAWQQSDHGTETPTAAFEIEEDNPPLNTPVNFYNTSSNSNYYNWSFGDGTTSTETNPVHAYATPGTYEVELETINCQGSSRVSHSLIVQQEPEAVIESPTRTIRLRRNEAYDLPITIGNTGEGELSWRYVSTSTPEVVTLWRKDALADYPNYIISSSGNHTVLEYNGEQYGTSLKEMLNASTILVIPRYYGNLEELRAVKEDILNFVKNGGILVITGQESNVLNELGYFQSSSYNVSYYDLLTKADASHPLLTNISGQIYGEYYTFSHTFSNKEELQEVLTYQGQTTVAVKPVENGYAIYLGPDYNYYPGYNLQNLLLNAVTVYSYPSVSWIGMQTESG